MPLNMDVFNQDAFSLQELTVALERVPYRPTMLGAMGIFESKPIRSTVAAIENRDGVLSLVPITSRGAPLPRRDKDKRQFRYFDTVRVGQSAQLRAEELQNIRAFGQVSELQQLMEEVMRLQVGVRDDVLLTHEYMRLGAVQGIVTDTNGDTVYNWFDEFGITQPAEIDFDLDNASPASGALRKKCNQVIRQMSRAARGGWVEGQTQIGALVGDAFWDDLTAHPEVRKTYEGWQAAQDLRNEVGQPWNAFRYGNITWVNYRGTDDGSTVAIETDKAKFFPINGREVFQWVQAPGESLDMLGQPGRETYSRVMPDLKRNEFVDIEVVSYPLYVCTRPGMLQRGRRT